jgi:hypothetical protein
MILTYGDLLFRVSDLRVGSILRILDEPWEITRIQLYHYKADGVTEDPNHLIEGGPFFGLWRIEPTKGASRGYLAIEIVEAFPGFIL